MRIHQVLATAAVAWGMAVAMSTDARAARRGDDLPDGEGKQILQASCTVCHDLTEVTKFKGFYTRDDWRDIVKTMIEYGAKVDARQADVLVEYLTVNLGKKP